ncbi:uncharacterized protein LOC110684841 isoform X2 [Chenopodium quinoa]|uniref:uncharacterized protein LOC110684841 isoform X2 n=1 Tax=Chenopodium quinoa TaxID=63459 RepID=UPI000B781948|nr:uncharacterized protein LOC110684841 isoform X2 [Chenopodium quinoa]
MDSNQLLPTSPVLTYERKKSTNSQCTNRSPVQAVFPSNRDGDEAVKNDDQWTRSPIVESSLLEVINNDQIQSDNFDNPVGDDAATTSNQFATTSSGNVNKSTKVDNKGGDPIEGELKVRAKDVPKKQSNEERTKEGRQREKKEKKG